MEKRILIADDEVDLCEILTFHFQSDGWIVLTTNNGQEALAQVEQFRPTVILSDINMPKMDGLAMLEKLHSMDLNIPVILLTGFSDVQKMQRAWAACAFDFLDKPFKRHDLLTLANNAHEHGADYVRTARKRYSKILDHDKK
jgi:DNA-binding NtrC family response regulator